MTIKATLPPGEVDLNKDPFEDSNRPPGYERLASKRAEFTEHWSEVSHLLRELEDDVDDLRVQEGWDGPTAAGAYDWATDRGMVFRALRRNHYDVARTHTYLLAALGTRVERGLGGQIPPPPTNLWYFLPLPITDRLGNPVVVLSLREVVRDEDGSLNELKDWTWWGLELIRRVIRDWWIDGQRGNGAEGVVLLIDVGGAGYRNMEVELLPTIMGVANNNFPSQIAGVYVVNAGWSQQTLWNSVVKRVLPRSAIDMVVFLQNRNEMANIFDLDTLPKSLGGNGPPVDTESMLRKYSHIHPHAASRPGSRAPTRGNSRAGSRAPSRSRSRSRGRGASRTASREPSMNRAAPSRNTSTSSIADVYYTAPNTPTSSRPPSRPISRRSSFVNASSLNLAMTKTTHETSTTDDPASTASTVKPATIEAAAGSTIQRIKSLSDFHLYLSPSRLANRDLLSDSEDDEPPPPPPMQRRVTLRPAMFEGSIAARRAATAVSPSRASTPQEKYASRLQAHHAKNLEKYCAMTDCSQLYRLDRSLSSSTDASPVSVNSEPTTAASPEVEHSTPATTPPPVSPFHESHIEPASDVQFSADNPWFGYPVVRVPNAAGSYSIRPRYGRNRKRDLVKTLLWLLILRLQSLRASFEKAIGLDKVIQLFSRPEPTEPRTPTDGLRQTAVARRAHTHHTYPPPSKTVARRRNHDWVWMLIGFLVCRGTWAPFIGPGLETLGLGSLKEFFGTV